MTNPRIKLSVAGVNDELYVIGDRTRDTFLAVNEKYMPIGYIPEFPSWTVMLLVLTILAVALAVYRRRLNKK